MARQRIPWCAAPLAAAAFLGGLPASGQNLSQLDARPFGEIGRPVGLAGSAFEVWVAYPNALLQFRRLGSDVPRWIGINQGLPLEGIASICYDDPSQSLWIQSLSRRWMRWSPGLGSAHEEASPVGGCSSKLARNLDIATIPNLTPSPPGWLRMGSDLVDPAGNRTRILQAISLDDRELWLATDAGVWSGRTITGRIDPRPAGLAESCARKAARDSANVLWLQGCQGSFTALVDDAPRALFPAGDPRTSDLRDPLLLDASRRRGVWVSVYDGLVRLTTEGLSERFLGRKAPFGGRALSVLERGDTLWCGTQRSLSFRVRSQPFSTDLPPWEAPGPVTALHAAPQGILAATTDGFWLRTAAGWVRPPELREAQAHTISVSALEPRPPHRLAWWDGRELHLDTLAGFGGQPERWLPGGTTLRSLSFDDASRLHLAFDGSWMVWSPASGERRAWKAGLGLSGDIYDVLPWGERAILAGVGGGSSVRIPSYAPGSNKSK